jgi:hypothetical protein
MTKGTLFEIQVADAVERDLASGNYGLDPTCSIVRRKPSYFSRDRNKNIVFDVSIEVCRRNISAPYWIWVWECKNYTHSVPVDDVEEFHAKLSQIGADRVKGSIITPIGFDIGAFEFAKSKGIGLWRFIVPGSPVSLMEDSRGVSNAAIVRGLVTPDTIKFRHYSSFYGLTSGGLLTTDEQELFSIEFANVKSD